MICDSNIPIYAAEPGDTRCRPWVQKAEAMISIVTRIEALGFHRMSQLSLDQQERLQTMVNSTIQLHLDEEIIQRAIPLRQQKKTSLADAIIAATALEYHVPLVTRNVRDFHHIPGLHLIDFF